MNRYLSIYTHAPNYLLPQLPTPPPPPPPKISIFGNMPRKCHSFSSFVEMEFLSDFSLRCNLFVVIIRRDNFDLYDMLISCKHKILHLCEEDPFFFVLF